MAFAGNRAEALRTETENLNISGRITGSRSPAGPRRLREHTRPRPKSGKVCRSDTRAGDVCERAERSEGSNSAPIRNAPVSPCVPPFSESRVCVPTFTRESKCGPFVREVEKRDERWSEIELLLIVRVHREPGNVCI